MDNKDMRLLRQIEDSAVSVPELSKKSEYSKQQVHYRLTEKWSEYVQKDSETENPGAARSTTLWNLSKAGKEKLESGSINEDKIETFNELREVASEASRDAKSAKESVQSYRKKVSRLDDRLSSIKDATGETWSDLDSEDATVLTQIDKEDLRADLENLRVDFTVLESDLESLDNFLDDLRTDMEDKSDEIEYLSDSVDDLENRLAEMESRNNKLKSENRKLATEVDTQSKRISELEDEIERMKNRTLIERILDMF